MVRKSAVQLGIVVSMLILTFACITVIGLHQIEQTKYHELNQRYQQKISVPENNRDSVLFKPEEITTQLQKHLIASVLITLLLIIITVTILIVIYHIFIGRYIQKLIELNKLHVGKSFALFPEDELPNNELKDLILARNNMLKELSAAHNDIEDELSLSKKKLVQAGKMSMLGEFTALIIHDLNNPIMYVSGLLHLAIEKLKKEESTTLDPKIISFLEGSLSGTKKISNLVQRMNSFNRVSGDRSESVNLHKLIISALTILETKINACGIEIKNETKSYCCACRGSKNEIEQVFMNIISNAIDAMEKSEEKVLRINCKKEKKYLVVIISDTGPGIPQKLQEKIFETFFTTKEDGKGTGLGLAICKQIVEGHHGELSVSSEEGKGTSFSITLPIAPSPDEKEKNTKHSQHTEQP